MLKIKQGSFTKVSDIVIPEIFYRRYKTGIDEFDQILGEGLLPGSTVLLAGTHGSGKSTFLLQYMQALQQSGYNIAYASGEENNFQLAYTCKRIGVDSIGIGNVTDIDQLKAATVDHDVIVVDSFQSLTTTKKFNKSEQERYAVATLMSAAKQNECSLVIVLHLTKAGVYKGSTLIPHAADACMRLTVDEEDTSLRILEVSKNRFGPIGDYGMTMTSTGFILSGKREVVKSPSKKTRQIELEEKILALDPPNITKERIIKMFNLTPSQTYFALKDLQDKGKLVKYGRGVNATWKKANP